MAAAALLVAERRALERDEVPGGKLREAIQNLGKKLDCSVALAPRNDELDTT